MRPAAGALLIAAALVAYNTAANSRREFQTWAYIPANLAAAVITLAAARALLGLTPREVVGNVSAFPAGLAAGLLASSLLLVLLVLPGRRRLLDDRRLDAYRGRSAAWYVFVRIPLGTVVLEELAFRGVLVAGLPGQGGWVLSSVAFGLWHMGPALAATRANTPDAAVARRAGAVAGAVVVTAAAGIALLWARDVSGGLGAPAGLHAGLNSGAAAVALVARGAARRGQSRSR